MPSVSTLDLPERPRNYRFALTPLADAMFQLLIFFMLSTGLTPYSMLPIQSAAAPAEPGAVGETPLPSSAPPAESALANTRIWTIEAEAIVVGGQRFDFASLADLAATLGTRDALANVVVIVHPSARVQDLTAVLAELQGANVASVQISTGDR